MWRAIRFGLDGRLIDLERARGVPGARGDRAARRLDGAGARRARHRARVSRAQRRPAPAPDDRGGRHARGGLRGLGRGDARDLFRGGDGVSTDPAGAPGDPARPGAGAQGQPSEEELRAAYEAELSRITSADMMLQAAVSLLNIGARRLGRGRRRAERRAAADAGRRRARPRAGARRDRRRQGAAGDPRAPRARGARPAARRALAAADRLRARGCRRAAPSRRAGRRRPDGRAPRAGRRRAGRQAGQGERRGPASRARPVPGRPSRAAGCGCPGAECSAVRPRPACWRPAR